MTLCNLLKTLSIRMVYRMSVFAILMVMTGCTSANLLSSTDPNESYCNDWPLPIRASAEDTAGTYRAICLYQKDWIRRCPANWKRFADDLGLTDDQRRYEQQRACPHAQGEI